MQEWKRWNICPILTRKRGIRSNQISPLGFSPAIRDPRTCFVLENRLDFGDRFPISGVQRWFLKGKGCVVVPLNGSERRWSKFRDAIRTADPQADGSRRRSKLRALAASRAASCALYERRCHSFLLSAYHVANGGVAGLK